MLSKSLIQFSVDMQGYVPSLLFELRPNYGGGNEDNGNLPDQCKVNKGKNRMGKSRDLFKKIRATKGTFHAKMGSIKDRNSMDLTEAEVIKKRWQENTCQLNKMYNLLVVS